MTSSMKTTRSPSFGCAQCHFLNPRSFRYRSKFSISITRFSHSSQALLNSKDSIREALATPSWSTRTLLPKANTPSSSTIETSITPYKLHHLLRLSALPPPATRPQESEMLRNLAAQLHFVQDVQNVNTDGIDPLCAVRDETFKAEAEQEVSVADFTEVLDREERVGFGGRIRWKKGMRATNAAKDAAEEDYDALCLAERKAGRYFIVQSTNVS